MELARKIIEEHLAARTFRVRQYPSRTVLGTQWEVRLLYGGSRERPLISCTCPKSNFGGTCFHIESFLQRMSAWDWMMYVHRDDIKNKEWKKISESLGN
jgi:hypothetical protein